MQLDSDKMDLYGLTSDKILKIIEETNDTTGLIGITTDTDGLKMLYIGDPTKTIEELTKMPIYYDEPTSTLVRIPFQLPLSVLLSPCSKTLYKTKLLVEEFFCDT